MACTAGSASRRSSGTCSTSTCAAAHGSVAIEGRMSDSRRAAIYLVITAAGFGGTWVAAPWATQEIAPLVVACIRFAIAAVLLLGFCRLRGLSLHVERRDVPAI